MRAAISNHDIRRSLRRRGRDGWRAAPTGGPAPTAEPMTVAELTGAVHAAAQRVRLRAGLVDARALTGPDQQQRRHEIAAELGAALTDDWRRFHLSHGTDPLTLRRSPGLLGRRLTAVTGRHLRSRRLDMRDVLDDVVARARLSVIPDPDGGFQTVG